MNKNFYFNIIFLFSLIFSGSAKANYWLIIGTYRQGTGGRPEVSGITSPSLHSIPMRDLDTCNKSGEKITNEILNLFGNLRDGDASLQVIRIKVTF